MISEVHLHTATWYVHTEANSNPIYSHREISVFTWIYNVGWDWQAVSDDNLAKKSGYCMGLPVLHFPNISK